MDKELEQLLNVNGITACCYTCTKWKRNKNYDCQFNGPWGGSLDGSKCKWIWNGMLSPSAKYPNIIDQHKRQHFEMYVDKALGDYKSGCPPLCPFADNSVEMSPRCLRWRVCKSCAYYINWCGEANAP